MKLNDILTRFFSKTTIFDCIAFPSLSAPNKMGLFRNNKELQLGTYGLKAKHMPVQGNGAEGGSFMDLGGSIVNRESIRGNQKVESRVTFHRLSMQVSH